MPKTFAWAGGGNRKCGEMEVMWVTSISQQRCRSLAVGIKFSKQNFSRFSTCQVLVLALRAKGKLQLEPLTRPSVTQ